MHATTHTCHSFWLRLHPLPPRVTVSLFPTQYSKQRAEARQANRVPSRHALVGGGSSREGRRENLGEGRSRPGSMKGGENGKAADREAGERGVVAGRRGAGEVSARHGVRVLSGAFHPSPSAQPLPLSPFLHRYTHTYTQIQARPRLSHIHFLSCAYVSVCLLHTDAVPLCHIHTSLSPPSVASACVRQLNTN